MAKEAGESEGSRGGMFQLNEGHILDRKRTSEYPPLRTDQSQSINPHNPLAGSNHECSTCLEGDIVENSSRLLYISSRGAAMITYLTNGYDVLWIRER